MLGRRISSCMQINCAMAPFSDIIIEQYLCVMVSTLDLVTSHFLNIASMLKGDRLRSKKHDGTYDIKTMTAKVQLKFQCDAVALTESEIKAANHFTTCCGLFTNPCVIFTDLFLEFQCSYLAICLQCNYQEGKLMHYHFKKNFSAKMLSFYAFRDTCKILELYCNTVL